MDLSAGRNLVDTAGNTEDIDMGTDIHVAGLNEYIYTLYVQECNKISY